MWRNLLQEKWYLDSYRQLPTYVSETISSRFRVHHSCIVQQKQKSQWFGYVIPVKQSKTGMTNMGFRSQPFGLTVLNLVFNFGGRITFHKLNHLNSSIIVFYNIRTYNILFVSSLSTIGIIISPFNQYIRMKL